jgi:Flp pilus assembly pilin Flp
VISVLQIRHFHREQGQTMAEYGVVLAVITAAALGALTVLSTNVGTALVRVAGLVGVGNG